MKAVSHGLRTSLAILFVFTILFALVACGGGGGGETSGGGGDTTGGGNTGPFTMSQYFPLSDGDTWTYKDTYTDGSEYATNTVTGTVSIGGVATKETTETYSNATGFGNDTDKNYNYITSNGSGVTIYQSRYVSGNYWENSAYTPPLNIFPASMTIGQKNVISSIEAFTSSDGTKSTNTTSWEVTLLGVEDITVPAGKFTDCLKLSLKTSGKVGTNTLWLAYGVGPIKFVTGSSATNDLYTAELVSAKVGGTQYGSLSKELTGNSLNTETNMKKRLLRSPKL
jgi:hypothetical protein